MNTTAGGSIPQDTASPSLPVSAFAAAGLGAAFHLASQNFELDKHAWRLIGGFYLYVFSAIVAATYYLGNGVLSATLQVVPLAVATLVGLYSSIAIRRLFLSPLRKFPGPWQARLSKFYHWYLESKNLQLFEEVRKMHEKYGDFVRTGPREISILRPSAIPLIYGGKSPCQKGPWYDQTKFGDDGNSLFNIINIKKHNHRRRIYDRGFSTKALNSYEPRVQDKVSTLLERLGSFEQKPVNVTAWMGYFSFDVMGDVIYSKEYNMMRDGNGKIAAGGVETTLSKLHDGMKMLGLVGTTPWILRMVSQMGDFGDFAIMQQWCRGAMKEKLAAWEPGTTPTDTASYLIKDFIDDHATTQQTQQSILQDSALLIIAGSDTTTSAAVNALYYLTKYPAVYARLQSILDATFASAADVTHDKAREIRLLDDIANETMRLKPPACEGLVRETPAEGLTVDGVFIPGKTIVSVPTWTIQRDARYWEDPEEWRPERWEGVNPNEEGLAFLPFSKGIFSCPGKMLAYMELRLLISRIALTFDIELAPGEDGVEFDTHPLDTFTMLNQPLQMVFKPRKQRA
ncbi:Cytochrome P450 [Lasiodiplodia theobromae]|uniref:Cytochrome P450 n=1 Tax=Lasiodiplodia theobromae TaxID=45133 RepID=UPI0015C35DCF|nr:Cytochrome P450 [Lasiodiplodia theobromae]KAF4541323.1 Cytochrome P450 [Lasiodiplodia theobromae]KAF9632717.1 Cytochrome P450 [Lasiodiplodia theobromae]